VQSSFGTSTQAILSFPNKQPIKKDNPLSASYKSTSSIISIFTDRLTEARVLSPPLSNRQIQKPVVLTFTPVPSS